MSVMCDDDDDKCDLPSFEAWSHPNLAKFAKEAYIKMQEQQDYIGQLQNDLKDSLAACRKLLKEKA